MGTGSEYAIEDYPANAVIMDRTHAQQAFASVAHMSIPPVDYAVPWEVGVDVALGKADSVDIDLHSFDRTQGPLARPLVPPAQLRLPHSRRPAAPTRS